MALELVSHPICPYVQRAAALLHEKGLPTKLTSIDLQAKPDWFLKISPRGKVPVLLVDGTALFESAAIVEYLDETQGQPMMPADPIERARVRGWIEIANDALLNQYKLFSAATPGDRAAAVAAARETLRRFEQAVVEPFFAGGAIGIVDIMVGPALLRFEKLNEWLALDIYGGLPKVAAWSKRISERPSFRETLVADFDERFRGYVKFHDAAA